MARIAVQESEEQMLRGGARGDALVDRNERAAAASAGKVARAGPVGGGRFGQPGEGIEQPGLPAAPFARRQRGHDARAAAAPYPAFREVAVNAVANGGRGEGVNVDELAVAGHGKRPHLAQQGQLPALLPGPLAMVREMPQQQLHHAVRLTVDIGQGTTIPTHGAAAGTSRKRFMA